MYQEMLYPAVRRVLMPLIEATKSVLTQCPPEVASDIFDCGIVLTGGGALLHGIEHAFLTELNVKVSVARDPLYSEALGGAKTLENSRLFDQLERPA